MKSHRICIPQLGCVYTPMELIWLPTEWPRMTFQQTHTNIRPNQKCWCCCCQISYASKVGFEYDNCSQPNHNTEMWYTVCHSPVIESTGQIHEWQIKEHNITVRELFRKTQTHHQDEEDRVIGFLTQVQTKARMCISNLGAVLTRTENSTSYFFNYWKWTLEGLLAAV